MNSVGTRSNSESTVSGGWRASSVTALRAAALSAATMLRLAPRRSQQIAACGSSTKLCTLSLSQW